MSLCKIGDWICEEDQPWAWGRMAKWSVEEDGDVHMKAYEGEEQAARKALERQLREYEEMMRDADV